MAIASQPLLFDSEVLVRESDVRLLLSRLVGTSSHYTIVGVKSIPNERATAEFGSDFESKAVLDRISDSDATLVEVQTDFGLMVLLLGERVGSYRSIVGIAIQ